MVIFFKNKAKIALKIDQKWPGGAETLPIASTTERNNWAKSEDDLSTLSERMKEFQCIFRSFWVNGDRQKNVDPHFRGLDLGAQVEFLHVIFFIPLVQSEFYQEIATAWSQHQYPRTDARRRSNTLALFIQ